jgi:glycosyltransferase involved in cell wall biosynthesis
MSLQFEPIPSEKHFGTPFSAFSQSKRLPLYLMTTNSQLLNPDNPDINRDNFDRRPVRVLLLLDTRAWAGTESHVLGLARALNSLNESGQPRQVEVTVAAPPSSELWRRAKKARLSLLPIARRGTWDWATIGVLARRLRRGAADVVHVHNGRTALCGALAVKLAGRGACVATHHFIEPAHATQTGLKGRLSGAVHKWIENQIAGHIAISRAVAGALDERGEVAPERTAIVPNGIEISPFTPSNEAALTPELRAEVVCVARLEREKDIPTLVRAMAHLNAARTSPVSCIVAGEGDERGAIEAAIAREAGCNVSLAGFSPLASAMLRAAQVAVLPSVAEPFGLALLEAMAQKKPVVAINCGGPPEIVVEGETGWLVPPGDFHAMARAIGDLLDDPERARTMGEAGWARLQEHFGADRMAGQTLAVYRRALNTSFEREA